MKAVNPTEFYDWNINSISRSALVHDFSRNKLFTQRLIEQQVKQALLKYSNFAQKANHKIKINTSNTKSS